MHTLSVGTIFSLIIGTGRLLEPATMLLLATGLVLLTGSRLFPKAN